MNLKTEINDLKRRIRLLKSTFYRCNLVAQLGVTDTEALTEFANLLDLRKPLPRKKKA